MPTASRTKPWTEYQHNESMRAVFYTVITSFLAGVMWRSLFNISLFETIALVLGACAAALVARLGDVRTSLIAVLAVLGCVLGVVRTEFAERSFAEGMTLRDGAKIAGAGVVVAEPDVRSDHTVIVIALDEYATTRVRASVPRHPALSYGDRVAAAGVVHIPEAFDAGSGRVFNYPGYLKKDGIQYELRDAQVTLRGNGGGSRIIAFLLSIKRGWIDSVSRIISEPGSSLLSGIVVGAKQSLGEAWLELFRTAGVMHIIVLSGYNLTIVAVFITWLLGRFSPRMQLVCGIAAIGAFALMTGAGATVVRSSLMAVVALFARYMHRPYALARALALSAFLMVCANPFVLMFDPGFQLSFAATLGLIYGSPIVVRWFMWLPETYSIREIVAATFATQFAVLPLLMYSVGGVSLVAPFVNVLILPLVPPLMAVGFAAGVVASVLQPLALPLAWLAHQMLSYIFFIVRTFAHAPFAAVNIPALAWWSIPLLYAALIGAYLRVRNTAGVEPAVATFKR